MAARTCPQCMKLVPALRVDAYSDGFQCPHCGARLEVDSTSRSIAVWVGLLAAFLVWYSSRTLGGDLAWVLPEFYAILTFGAVTPLVLLLIAELCIAPELPVPTAAAPHHADPHASAHH